MRSALTDGMEPDRPSHADARTVDRGSGAPRRVVVVGGVAGGMSTATRLRRLDADVAITVLERSGHVSFANCGLPYFVGGLIEEEDDLTLQTPSSSSTDSGSMSESTTRWLRSTGLHTA